MKRKGSAVWTGDLRTGKGAISTESGALENVPYGFNTRFGDEKGTNPEELIGAAHAACFSMALSNELSKAGIADPRIRRVRAQLRRAKRRDRQRGPDGATADSTTNRGHGRRTPAPRVRGEARLAQESGVAAARYGLVVLPTDVVNAAVRGSASE